MSSVRSLRMDVVVCLYAMFFTVLSIAFPVTFAVTHVTPAEAHYVPALLIYLSSGSLVFLTYVCLRIYHFKRPIVIKKVKDVERLPSGENGNSTKQNDNPVSIEHNPESVSLVEKKKWDISPPLTPVKISKNNSKKTRADDPPPFTFKGKGANFFMRMGIVAFCLGSVLLEGFRLFSYAEHGDVIECFGILFTLTAGTRLFAYLLQSYFLFKYHNIVLNFEVPIMKLGVAHLVVFNISGWFTTVAFEAQDTIIKLKEEPRSPPNTTINTGANMTIVQRMGCNRNRVMADEVGGYLYPVVIAYSMLSAALLVKIYTGIGLTARDLQRTTTPTHGRHNSHCYKANSGLFLGLTVVLLTVSSACFFLYFNKQNSNINDVPGLIFLMTTLGVNICALICLPPAMHFVQKLKFIPQGGGSLDDVLLLFSLAGHYMLLAVMFIPCTTTIYVAKVNGISLKSLGCVCFLVDFIQSTLQVAFILDGVRRCSSNQRHVTEKPGRSLVTFLLLCNMSTWLVSSLELKESYDSNFFTDFYGPLTWILLLYVSLPLSIFFRFHSSVCLSNIWLYAYELPVNQKREKPKVVNSTTQTFIEVPAIN